MPAATFRQMAMRIIKRGYATPLPTAGRASSSSAVQRNPLPPHQSVEEKHARLEKSLKYFEAKVLNFADRVTSLDERTRFKGSAFPVVGSIVMVAGASLVVGLVFRQEIYRYLGKGGAEVAAEVVKSEALQHQVEESLTGILKKLSTDEEARKTLIDLLQKVARDPASLSAVAEFAKALFFSLHFLLIDIFDTGSDWKMMSPGNRIC